MIILIISLRVATYSNVLLNEPELGSHSSSSESSPSLLQRSTFIAGDWNEINNLLMVPHVPPLAPTLILGSETVYRTENFRPQKLLLQLLIGKNGLHPEGSALFSGRGYYFGVGGGINAFRVFLETIQPPLEASAIPQTVSVPDQSSIPPVEYPSQDEVFDVETVWTSPSGDSSIIKVTRHI